LSPRLKIGLARSNCTGDRLDDRTALRHTPVMSRHTGKKSTLKTLSIKVPASVSARVVKLARSRGATISAVVREAIEQYAPADKPSFAEAAKAWVGSVDGGPGDLATNPRHLKGFGK
jgi:predicted transcriptional regulator